MDEKKLIQKLRQLKRIEFIVRFGSVEVGRNRQGVNLHADLTWDSFFSERKGSRAKYPFDILLIMNNEGRRRIFAEYLHTVYTEGYKEKGLLFPVEFDYYALLDFDLPAGASKEEVKKKFRELAKIAHPDHGGSNEAMLALLEQYHKLLK